MEPATVAPAVLQRDSHTKPDERRDDGPPVDVGLAAVLATAAPADAARWLLTRVERVQSRRSSILVPVVVYLLLTIVMTWPYASRLGSSIPVGQDPLQQAWILRWVQHALWTDPLHLYDGNIFFPFNGTIAYMDSMVPLALLAAPILWVTRSMVLTYGVLTLATFLLASMGMYFLVRKLTGSRAGALFAGAAFAFLPYRYVHLWHLNQLGHAWTPWALLSLLRLVDRPSRRRSAELAGVVAVLVLTTFYLAFQLALLFGFVLVVGIARDERFRRREFLTRLAMVGVFAAIVVAPFALPYLAVRDDQGLERTAADIEYSAFKATPGSYLTTPPWDDVGRVSARLGVRPGENTAWGFSVHADGHVHREIELEHGLFPGFVVLAAAAVGFVTWWRRDRLLPLALLLTGVVAFVLSLGGTWRAGPSLAVPLPYRWLFTNVPLFRSTRVPARFGVLVAFCLVVMAGYGAAVMARRLGASFGAAHDARSRTVVARRASGSALAMLLAGVVLLEFHAAPVPLQPLSDSDIEAPVYKWLAEQPGNRPVIEFPAQDLFDRRAGSSDRWHVGLRMLSSTLHWKPLVNGYQGFIPSATTEFLATFRADLTRPDGSVSRDLSYVQRHNVPTLQDLGVRHLIVHKNEYTAADWPTVEAALASAAPALRRAATFRDAHVYTVADAPRRPPLPIAIAGAPEAPGGKWEPVVVLTNPQPRVVLNEIAPPRRLAVTWFDQDGRKVASRKSRVQLPPVAAPGQQACSIEGCQVPVAQDEQLGVPRVDPHRWTRERGAYRVEVQLEDGPRCSFEVRVTAPRARPAPLEWTACEKGVAERRRFTPYVAPPLHGDHDVTRPEALVLGDSIAVHTSMLPRDDADVRAWFFLADPDEDRPWERHAFLSPTVEKSVEAGRVTDFEWRVPRDVRPGTYALTVWFHRRVGNEWVHATGGRFGSPLVTIEEAPSG